MTSPTIIQSPGALDTATSAFMQAYVASNQLARQRQALQIEQEKAASQIALQGAEAGEAKTRTKQMEAQLEDLDLQHQGLQFAAGHLDNLDDPTAFMQASQGLDPRVAGYAAQFRDQFRKSAADAAQAQAQTGEAQARTRAIARDTEENAQIGQITSQYSTRQLQSPTTLLEIGRRVLAQTGNPQKAKNIIDALTPPNADFTFIHGPNGELYMGDQRSGRVVKTGYNLGVAQTAGSIRANATKMAWAQVADAVTGLDQLARQHGIAATAVPNASALAEGLSELGAFGVKPFKKLGGTAAQAARSDPQQQAVSLYAQLIHNLATTQGGYRSMALLNSMGTAYAAQSGQRTAELQALNAKRLRLLSFARAGMMGQDLDITQLPGFETWSKDLMEAAQHGQPAEGEEESPVSEDDLNQFAQPRP